MKCPRNHRTEVMNVGGSRASGMVGVLPGTGAASAIRIAIVIESVKESASGTGIGAITTGVNARATRIATDRKTTIGSGTTEAMRDPVKVLILRVGRGCDTKVGINIIIISFISFKLFTLNVCRLVTPAKRDSVLQGLSLLDLDIILLQETHVSNKTQADEISKRWSGDCFWSFGTGRKAGVAMFVSPRFQGKISKFLFDSYGRIFSALIDFGSCKFNLINVFAPNTVVGRKVFFSKFTPIFLVSLSCYCRGF